MPNWCTNKVTIKGPQAKLKKLQSAFKAGKFLASIMPEPNYKKTVVPSLFPTISGKLVADPKESWYDWRVQNWGTKWDVGGKDAYSKLKKGELYLEFDSAWSAPVGALLALAEDKSLRVKGYYWEPGMGFAGMVSSDYGELYFDDHRKVPEELDNALNISGQLKEWESDE